MAMTEQKRKRFVYALFVVAVIWGLYNEPWKRHPRPANQDMGAATVEPAAAQAGIAAAGKSPAEPKSPVREWTTDPFRADQAVDTSPFKPQADTDHSVPEFQGTMLVGGRRLCVLDNRVHRVGERVKDWTIVKIGPGEVLIQGPAGQSLSLAASDQKTGD